MDAHEHSHGHAHGHAHGHGHGHGHGHAQLGEAEWAAWADHTELDGEVLVSVVTDVAAQVAARRAAVGAVAVRTIIDIGSGPAVATCELARCFPGADAMAVDGSPGMLARADRRIERLGMRDRVATRLAELPDELEALAPPGSVDLVWASMSLHHMGDEVGALRGLRTLLAADGLLAIVEMAEPVAMLPSGLGVGTEHLAAEVHAASTAWFAEMRAALPGSIASQDLAVMVAAAGLEVLHDRVVEITLDPPLTTPQRQVVLGHLRRTRDQLRDRIGADDQTILDALCDPDDPTGVMHAPDVVLRASRRVVIAGRDATG